MICIRCGSKNVYEAYKFKYIYMLRRHDGGKHPIIKFIKKTKITRRKIKVSKTFKVSKKYNYDYDWQNEHCFVRAVWRCGKCRKSWRDLSRTLQAKYTDGDASRYNLKKPISMHWSL